MRNFLTKPLTSISLGALIGFLMLLAYLYQYFSPEGQCEREVRESEAVSAMERVSNRQTNPMAQQILESLIESEIQKCLEAREEDTAE